MATLVNGWTKQGGVPRIERDIALDELRSLYNALLDIDFEQSVAPAMVVAVEEPKEEVAAVADPVADFDDALDIDALLGIAEEEKPQDVATPEPKAEPAPAPVVEPEPEPKVARGGGLFDIEDIPVRQKSGRKMISLYNAPTTTVAPATPEPKVEPMPASAPAPVATVSTPAPVAQPQPQSVEPQRIADVLGSGRKVLGDVSQNEAMPTPPMSKISDLRKAIGINDKFIMLRDLFAGNEAQYNTTIDALNSFTNLDDCMIYIVENFAWNPDSEGAKLIVSLIERKLS